MYRNVIVISLLGMVILSCGSKNGTSDSKTPEAPAKPLANVEPTQRADYYAALPEQTIDESKRYIATIQSSKGDIVVELDAVSAPLHTNNFVFLSRQGFYDGLTFHRVIPRFVAQGGDPLGRGTGGPGYKIPAEFGLPHQQGVIAMARQPDEVNPDRMSSGSQFYITLEPQSHLDQQGYSVFGRVTKGFDVVQKIAQGDLIKRIDIEEQ